MSAELDERDERLLEAVVLGELAPDAPEVRTRAAESPELAEALADWTRTHEGLERVRAEDERLIEAAKGEATPADRELVAELLARSRAEGGAEGAAEPHRPGSTPGPPTDAPWDTRTHRLGPWLAAAAVLLTAALLWTFAGRGGEPEPGPTTLLGDDACVRPRGEVEEYSPFVVDLEVEPMETQLTIRVYAQDGDEILRSGTLDAPIWELSPEQAARLRDEPRITWRYERYDRILDAWDYGECEAWRSP